MINSFAPVDPALVDVIQPQDGYPDHLAAEDTRDNLMSAAGAASREFPPELYIEPRNWAEKAKENDENRTWAMNYIDRYTNQSPTDECTTHSESRGFEACWNRQRGVIYGGPQKDVRLPDSAKFGSLWVAPLSVYAEANPQIRGGANCLRVMEIVIRRGFLPETIQPKNYGFKHALHGTTGKGGINQASGPWVPLSRFPEGWQATAANFRILEVIFPETIEQVVCCVFAGLMVMVGRRGHAIPYGQVILDAADPTNLRKLKLAYTDSYDRTLYDGYDLIRQAVGGAHAIGAVTTPDDWDKPAG